MKPWALWLVCGVGPLASPLQAHRFTAEWRVEDRALVVTAQLEGAPAAGARVELRDPADQVLAQGRLDAAGRFRWPLPPADGELRAVIRDEEGHRRTLTIPVAALAPAGAAGAGAGVASGPARTGGGRAEGVEPLAVRVVLGLTFLLAVTATWLGYHNRRRLAALEQRRPEDARGG